MAVVAQPQHKYFENFLEKKEKKWIQYWVVLIGNHLCFFKDKQTQIREHLIGRLTLVPSTTVAIGKSKKNNYQFQVTTAKGMYILRATSEKLRDIWMQNIVMASKGKVPGGPPMQPHMAPAATPYRYQQPYNPQHGVQHSGYPGYPQQTPTTSGYSSYPQQPGGQFFSPQQQYPSQQQFHPYPGYPVGSAQKPQRRSVSSRDLPAPPVPQRPSQEYGMPGVALLPGQRIALEEEQKRKEQQQSGELLPGERKSLAERRHQKDRELTGTKSDSALQLRRHSDRAYVDMAPTVAVAGTTVAMAGVQAAKKGENLAASKPIDPILNESDDDADDGYVTPWEDADWFYYPLSREAAEDLLKYKGSVGSFLVRESESTKGDYSLSVRNDDKIRHYKIMKSSGAFTVMGIADKTFKDLIQLVSFYNSAHEGRLQPLLKEGRRPALSQHKPDDKFVDVEEELALDDYLDLVDEMGESTGSATAAKKPPEPEEPPDAFSDGDDISNIQPKFDTQSPLPVFQPEVGSGVANSSDDAYFVMTKEEPPEAKPTVREPGDIFGDLDNAISELEKSSNLQVETEEVQITISDKEPAHNPQDTTLTSTSSVSPPPPNEPPPASDDDDGDLDGYDYPDVAEVTANVSACNVKSTASDLNSSPAPPLVTPNKDTSSTDFDTYDVPDEVRSTDESAMPGLYVNATTTVQPDTYVAEDGD